MKAITHTVVGPSLALFGLMAGAQEAPSKQIALDIKPQPMVDALNGWAQQTGFQIIVPDACAAIKLDAPRVRGRLTAHAALSELLAGTPLTYEFVNERTVAIHEQFPVSVPAVTPATGKQFDRRFVRVAVAQVEEEARRESDGGTAESESRAIGAANAREAENNRRQRGVLEEIIVTAQKREERLLDVPISITALSGDDLDRSTLEGLTEELNRVPGVATFVSNLGAGTTIMVRGVSGGTVFDGSSSISYYLDSVPFGFVRHAMNPDAHVYDLDRVEVLRGPQGTLYGANAQNGVVRVLTRDANVDEFEFKGRASTSSTKQGDWSYRGDMALNVPLIEGKVAARAVLGYQDLGGWIDKPDAKDINDTDVRNVRFKLKAQPTEQLALDLSVWLSRADYGAPPHSDGGARRSVSTQFAEPTDVAYDIHSIKVGYDFPGVSVTGITGYIDYESGGDLDVGVLGLPGFILFSGFKSKVLSQEIIINSAHGGPWRWTVGAMYRDVKDRLVQFITQDVAPGIFQLDFGQTSQSIAVFGELTRLFADGRYELTAGLRYFEDDVGDTENQLTTGATPPLLERKDTFSTVTPRVILNWHPSDEMTIYASYSEGFRSGFNQWALVTRVAPEFPSVREDKLRNYELGAKSSVWSGRLSFDAALYYIDWQDIKQGRLVDFNGIPISASINGESASGLGVDLGATVLALDGLEFGLNLNWNDLTLDQDGLDAFNNVVVEKGARATFAPEWTAAAWADYSFPLGRSGFEGRLSTSVNYHSALADSLVQQSGDSILTGRASFSIDAPENWTAALFVDNITNEDARVLRDPRNIPDWDTRIRPRTIGVQIEYRY